MPLLKSGEITIYIKLVSNKTHENNVFLFLDIKSNSPILMKPTRKSNIPLPNASSIKDLSV